MFLLKTKITDDNTNTFLFKYLNHRTEKGRMVHENQELEKIDFLDQRVVRQDLMTAHRRW